MLNLHEVTSRGESLEMLLLPIKLLIRDSNMCVGYQYPEQVEKALEQSGVRKVFATDQIHCRVV